METAKDRGGGSASVRNVISGSDAGGINIWGRDLGFVGGNVPEAGGSAHGLPQIDDGEEGKSLEGKDLEKKVINKGAQGSRQPDTGGVHSQATGNDGGVGVV